MSANNKRLILACCGILALAACGGPKDKIGSTIKGERIALMENAKTIKPDADVQNDKPVLSAPVSNGDWGQAGYNPEHLLPNARLSDAPHEIWRVGIGDGSSSDYKLLARPVVGRGLVFTMDAQGLLTASRIKDGEKAWSFETMPEDADNSATGGGVGLDGDTLYAATGFGEVIAINADKGTVKWRKSLGNPLRAAPTIADNRVYAVSIDNQLTALDATMGNVLWQHRGIAESATLMGASSPAVSGNNVIAAYSSGEMFDLRAENGRASWNFSLTTPMQIGALPAIADIRGVPVIDNGHIYAISHSGRLASIELRSGDRAWETDVGGINTPVISGDSIFILDNEGQLLALKRYNGHIMWVHELQRLADPADPDSDRLFWTGPILANNRLWLVNSHGQLASFAPEDGNALASVDLGQPAFVTPVVADGVLYAVTDNGELVALR